MDDLLAISALRHYAYCPRSFALIHVEQVWQENRSTAEGRILHERVDSGERETRGAVRYERGVSLVSYKHGLIGKMDLLEIETIKGAPPRYFPVEYKRGKPKRENNNHIQLCAQALCLEEMLNISVTEGAIWYGQTKTREIVAINADLRAATIAAIKAAKIILQSGTMPAPINKKSRCRGCSLQDICKPDVLRNDHSQAYIEELFGS